MRRLLSAALAAGVIVAAAPAVPVLAQGSPKAAESKKPDFPPIAEKTKGMDKTAGFLTLYRDEDKDLLWAEIPGKQVGKDFLMAATITAGQSAGTTARDSLVRFERHDDEVLLVIPEVFYEASGELKEVVQATYPDQVIGTAKVVAKTGNNVLIDLKSFLQGQTGNFAYNPRGAKVTQVGKAKTFPENTVVELTFRGDNGATGVYFTMSNLVDTGYKPRVADTRIGYFLTAKQDFSADPRADTTFERFINRWHIEKADPSLDMSPPKEPIVIYIEHTVPTKFRRWVREGIESWNEAFEEIGIVGAIDVRQQTKNNEFADLDPEDSRYNFIRWITSQRAYAIAPSRVDPRTGQVLDSDILFDESMVRFYIDDYDFWINSVPEAMEMSPRMRLWLAENPTEHPLWNSLRTRYQMMIRQNVELAGYTPEKMFAEDLMGDGRHLMISSSLCNIGSEMRRQMAFADVALRLTEFQQFAKWASQDAEGDDGDPEVPEGGDDGDDGDDGDEEPENGKKDLLEDWPEDFIGPMVKDIVAHEVGHTLGLRHNFKASTWKTMDEILNPEDPDAATTGSVMDYNAFVMNPDGTAPPNWVTPRIGPYDKWAIEYGYAIAGTNGYPKNEKAMLKKILEKVGQDGLQYGTDEDAWSPDPVIVRWDMAKDPLNFHQVRMQVADRIEGGLLTYVAEEGEGFDKVRSAFQTLMWVRYQAAASAARFIGGYDINRYYKGDAGGAAPIDKIDAKTQREAMELIASVLFAEDAFKYDAEILRNLAVSRWSHRNSNSWSAPHLYPFQDQVLTYQTRVLFSLTNPERIQYVYDSAFYADGGDDVFTLPELMEGLTGSIWSEVLDGKGGGSAQDPAISHLRRNLQREYAGRLITIATADESSAYPAVARTLAWKQLKDLGAEIDSLVESKGSGMDPYTIAHLEETSSRIASALDAQYTVGGSGGGANVILMMGQDTPTAGAPGASSNPFVIRQGNNPY